MTHPSLDPFSLELLRRIVPTGPDGQPLPVADLRAQRATLCLVRFNPPLPGRTEAQFASQIVASHVTVMECFRPAMLKDVSDRTWQDWVRGVAAHALHATHHRRRGLHAPRWRPVMLGVARLPRMRLPQVRFPGARLSRVR